MTHQPAAQTAPVSSAPAPSVHEDGSPARLAIDTIRTLTLDAVTKAKSGHIGSPLDLAPTAYALWTQMLRYDPSKPDWPNRDRFVLSAGHASMLLYATLHLAGVEEIDAHGNKTGKPAISLDDIKAFRQLGSKTPGHPEYRMTAGVETTTGPLGQGCANSVGMAIAAQVLAQRFNRPGFDLFDYDVYAVCGDGCMMEGVASEAASLAGHLALPNLCWIYDRNQVSIEGSTDLAFTEDVGKRFEAYAWNVIHVPDANDLKALGEALAAFKATTDKPTLIVVDSVIGYGSPMAGTGKAHGEALGEPDLVKETKEAYGWPPTRPSWCPTASRRPSPPPSPIGAAPCARRGRISSSATARRIRTRPRLSTSCAKASCPTAGTKTCPPSPPTPRAWPRATRAARC